EGSLAAGGPEFRLGLLLFLVGRPNRLARVGELAGDPLHLAGDPVERVAQSAVLAQRLEATALAEAEQRLVGVLTDRVRPLAHGPLDLVVAHLDPEIVSGGLEHELPRNRPCGLVTEPRHELLRLLAGHREIRLERDAPRLDLPREPAQQLARPRFD